MGSLKKLAAEQKALVEKKVRTECVLPLRASHQGNGVLLASASDGLANDK